MSRTRRVPTTLTPVGISTMAVLRNSRVGNRAVANTLSVPRCSSRILMPVSTLSVRMVAETADSATEGPTVIADSYRSNRPFTFMPKAALAWKPIDDAAISKVQSPGFNSVFTTDHRPVVVLTGVERRLARILRQRQQPHTCHLGLAS